jgi:hypothetical protein
MIAAVGVAGADRARGWPQAYQENEILSYKGLRLILFSGYALHPMQGLRWASSVAV